MAKLQHTTCPRCGEALTEISGQYPAIKCSTNKGKNELGCGFILWLNYNQHQLTAEEIDALLSKKKIIVSCISQKGKAYKREIYMDDNHEITYDEPFISEGALL